jgi:predicted ATPase
MGVAHGRQIVCSSATAELVRDRDDLREPREHRLRDLLRAEHVWQIGRGEHAPLRSLGSTPGNLPSQLTTFVGREADVVRVVEALGSTRAVTLTGVGGVGKTRLALQAAASISGRFRRRLAIELAALSDADGIDRILALTLDIGQQQGRSLRETLVDFFADKSMLLVLDNCEHLARSLPLARRCAAAQCTATCRDRDRPERRSVSTVSGSRWSGRCRRLISTSLRPRTSNRWRCSSIEPELRDDFALTGGNRTAVIEIVRRLDGIPLAIELAAARVPIHGTGGHRGATERAIRLLTGGRKTALERHQTLRAAVSWSVDLLNDSERSVFFRLGVFSGTSTCRRRKCCDELSGQRDRCSRCRLTFSSPGHS